MPNPCGPWKDSPESFSKTLLYAGFAFFTLLLPAFFAAAMSLRFARFKITGIVTNYPRPRTFGVREQVPAFEKKAPRFGRDARDLFQMAFKLRFDWRGHRGHFGPGRSAADFSDLEPHEAPDRNIFAQLDNGLGDHLADGHAFVLDEVLLVEAVFFVKLFHLAVDDFLDDRFRLARGQRLRLIDVALYFEHLRRHFFTPHVAWIQRRDVHRDIMRKLLERVRARHEIRLAVQLHQHADFPAGVDVAPHQPLAGLALRLLGRGRLALL